MFILGGLRVTKADIVDRIHAVTGLSRKEAQELTESLFSIIKSSLETGENIKISGFGNFVVKQKADRKGRNPQTGEEMTITARQIVTFRPSILLRQAVNGARK